MGKVVVASFPGRAAIDAYGNGGFRFAGMSHKGSILCLPSGIFEWAAEAAVGLEAADFERVLGETGRFDVLLLGTGRTQVFPSGEIRSAFAAAGIGLEVMDTGAAARTYNVLLAEGRDIGAALIAVD